MGSKSNIGWTESTWNPSTGCSKVSAGCDNCYAEKLSLKLQASNISKYKKGFDLVMHEKDIELPLRWKKPRRIFVNSMSDLFHEKMEFEFIDKCFKTMMTARQHVYQILTKRPFIMEKYSKRFMEKYGEPIPNHIWMGVSVENQSVIKRIDMLKNVSCAIRFISFEPLIGPISNNVDLTKIDWAIIGGESGENFRPVKEEWINNLIKTCEDQNVKIFFKQWGGLRPLSNGRTINGRRYDEYPSIGKTVQQTTL